MEIKAFKDGNSFVMNFVDLDDAAIDKLVSKFKPTLLTPVNAKPLVSDELPIPKEKKAEDRRMTAGPLKGLTVEEALSEKGDIAFKILSFYLTEGKLKGEEKEHVKKLLNAYVLYRFKDHDSPKEEVESMSDKELNAFLSLFSSIIANSMWSTIKAPHKNLQQLSEKQKTALAYLVIKKYAHLAKKKS